MIIKKFPKEKEQPPSFLLLRLASVTNIWRSGNSDLILKFDLLKQKETNKTKI